MKSLSPIFSRTMARFSIASLTLLGLGYMAGTLSSRQKAQAQVEHFRIVPEELTVNLMDHRYVCRRWDSGPYPWPTLYPTTSPATPAPTQAGSPKPASGLFCDGSVLNIKTGRDIQTSFDFTFRTECQNALAQAYQHNGCFCRPSGSDYAISCLESDTGQMRTIKNGITFRTECNDTLTKIENVKPLPR